MKFIPHKKFIKKLQSLPKNIQAKTKERLDILSKNSNDPVLRNHELRGKYKGYRSINITGDYRVIFEEHNNSTILLLFIETHSELYE